MACPHRAGPVWRDAGMGTGGWPPPRGAWVRALILLLCPGEGQGDGRMEQGWGTPKGRVEGHRGVQVGWEAGRGGLHGGTRDGGHARGDVGGGHAREEMRCGTQAWGHVWRDTGDNRGRDVGGGMQAGDTGWGTLVGGRQRGGHGLGVQPGAYGWRMGMGNARAGMRVEDPDRETRAGDAGWGQAWRDTGWGTWAGEESKGMVHAGLSFL